MLFRCVGMHCKVSFGVGYLAVGGMVFGCFGLRSLDCWYGVKSTSPMGRAWVEMDIVGCSSRSIGLAVEFMI